MHRTLLQFDSDQEVGVSFDITSDRKYLLKLCQTHQCLYSYKIEDAAKNQTRTHCTLLSRPIDFNGHGSLRNNLRCAPKSQHFAYTDRSHVYVGEFSGDIGFTDKNQMSRLDFMSPVSSIDWAHDQTHLVGGSDDDYASFWDVEKGEIVRRFKENSAASKMTLVATCRRNTNLFATCHDRDIKVWDRRRSSSCQSFSGHANKITHLDWSPHEDQYFLTCSLDRTVKLWSWKQPRVPVTEKRIGQQVWRALYDPLKAKNVFIAIIVPEDKQNGVAPLVCEFFEDSDYNLNTTSDSPIVEARILSGPDCGVSLLGMDMKGHFKSWQLESTVPGAGLISRHSLTLNLISPNDSKDPVTAFNHEMPTLSSSPNSTISLPARQNFPEKYGKSVQVEGNTTVFYSSKFRLKMETAVPETPRFIFEESPLSVDKKDFYLRRLDDRSREIVLEGSRGSETAMERLVHYVWQEINEINQEIDEDKSLNPHPSRLGKANYEKCIPFPRTNGARFCSNNILIIMSRPPNATETTEGARQKTPRAYCEMNTSRVGTITKKRDKTPSTPSVSEYYYSPSIRTRQTRGQSESATFSKVRPVEVRDLSGILPGSCRDLAAEFSLDPGRSLAELCEHNMAVAAARRRSDLVQMWRVLRVCTNPALVEHLYKRKLWEKYPYGRKLVDSYIECYYLKKDVQSLAMIYGMCTLVERQIQECSRFEGRSKFKFIQPGRPLFSLSESLSTSVSIENQFSEESGSEVTLSPLTKEEGGTGEVKELSGLDGDLVKLNYASILYNWKLLNQRAEVLKTVASVPERLRPEHVFVTRQPWECAVCRLPVKTLGSVCLECYHGGHSNHLRAWFSSSVAGEMVKECPTGCGCLCVDHMGPWT